jgi:hypothetical protein
VYRQQKSETTCAHVREGRSLLLGLRTDLIFNTVLNCCTDKLEEVPTSFVLIVSFYNIDYVSSFKI